MMSATEYRARALAALQRVNTTSDARSKTEWTEMARQWAVLVHVAKAHATRSAGFLAEPA